MAYALLTSLGCLLPSRPGRRTRLSWLAATAAFACVGCFTDPINRAPIVWSIDRSSEIVRGQSATFTALASDPDFDRIELSFGSTAGGCDVQSDSSKWPPATVTDAYAVPPALTSAPFCVWAFATDRYGAVGVRNQPFNADDRAPVAIVDLTSPGRSTHYPLYQTFTLDGRSSSDPDDDPITDYSWSLAAPSGSTAQLAACDGASQFDAPRCFHADRAGLYAVSLEVTSGAEPNAMTGTSPAGPLLLDVLDDTPPCIRLTDPAYDKSFISLSPDEDQDFAVQKIEDDGDPYPSPGGAAQNLTFTWYRTGRGEPATTAPTPQSAVSPGLKILAGTFDVGDTTTVRLEVHDRRASAIDQTLIGCGNSAFCPVPQGLVNTQACYQRVSWTVRWQ